MEKLLEKLVQVSAETQQAVKAMTEAVTAKFSTVDPAAKDAEQNALIEKVLAKINEGKTIRKMVFAVPQGGLKDNEKLVSFGKFLKAVVRKDVAMLDAMGLKAPNGQDETDNADGLYTVPVEAATEIIKLEKAASIAETICRSWPMNSKTRTIPKQLTQPTVTWTGEGVNHTKTKVTFDQILQTAKKVSALIPMTEEWLEDDASTTDQFIFQIVAEAIAREIDKIAFVGDVSGLSDPFNGVFFGSGVNSVSLEAQSFGVEDVINLMMAPGAAYRPRGRFVLSTTALKKVMKLKDDNGNLIWTMPEAGNPGRILGKPYDETDAIPDTLGSTRTNGANTAILFGAFDAVYLSPRGGYDVKGSDSASDANGGAGSAFLQDEIWYKFRRRLDITVANGEALAKLAIEA